MRPGRSVGILLLCASTSCSNGTGPESVDRSALIYVGGSRVRALDRATDASTLLASFDGEIEGASMEADRRHLLLSVRAASASRELHRIDICNGSTIWRTPMFSGAAHPVGGIELATGEVMATAPDGSMAYLYRAFREDVVGIASLDLETNVPIAFSGPWTVAGGGIVPIGGNVVGSRDDADYKLYLLDGATLAVRDSIGPGELGVTGEFWSVAALDDDGRLLLISRDRWLALYSLREKKPLRMIARPVTGGVYVSATRSMIVLTDAGQWPDAPGSGLVHVYDAQLNRVGTIDVSTPLGAMPGEPSATVTRAVAFAADGTVAYISAGTPANGPLYPRQPSRVIEVDLTARTVRRVYEMGDYSRWVHPWSECVDEGWSGRQSRRGSMAYPVSASIPLRDHSRTPSSTAYT